MENEYDDRQRSSREAGVDPGQDLPTDPQWHNPSLQVRQNMGDSGTRLNPSQMESGKGAENRQFYVYCLRRQDKKDPIEPWHNCPFYIGKECNGRHLEHRKEARSLLNKPGRKQLRIGIIHKLWKLELDFEEHIMFDNLTEQEAFELECMAIEAYGRFDLGTGILANLTNGGEGSYGLVQSEESRKKRSQSLQGKIFTQERCKNISNALKGNQLTDKTKQKLREINLIAYIEGRSGLNKIHAGPNPMLGKHHTPETKRKIGDANKVSKLGIKPSEETKQKMKDSHTGEKNHFYDKHHTEDTKQKIRDKKKGSTHTEDTKKQLSEIVKEQWKDPLIRQKRIENLKKKKRAGQGADSKGEKQCYLILEL